MPNYRQTAEGDRKTIRLPIMTDEHINLFSGASISNRSGLIYNGILDQYAGDKERTYLTGRPSIKIFDDASDTVTKASGRGIYYWAAASARYFVNDDTVYKTDYSTACTVYDNGSTQVGLTTGTERVYFIEYSSALDDYLFIINPESSQIFVIARIQGSTVLVNLDDVWTAGVIGTGDGTGLGVDGMFAAGEDWDFTGLQAAIDVGICHGAVSLDQYFFLGVKTSAKIYNSGASGDPSNMLKWDAAAFVTCERETDQLLYIDKSKDHLIALGERSTELFYDAANAFPASPLSPRTDIYYNIGIVGEQSAWRDGDDIYVLGMKPNGDFHMFTLRNFQLEENSTSTVDSYLRQSRTEAALTPVMSGFSTGNHTYAVITMYNSSNTPQISLVWDDRTRVWYEWDITLLNQSQFCLMDWSIRTPEVPVTAEGILCNGDLIFTNDNFIPIDSTSTVAYFAQQYQLNLVNGYSASTVTAAGGIVSANIVTKALITNIEVDTNNRKFLHSLEYVGNKPVNSQSLLIEWSDDEGQNWFSSTIDINTRTQINRLGSFDRRRFRMTYSGDEQIRMEALDATYSQGIAS